MPENTLVAIESAIRLGVDMVEIDIRLTEDDIPVLMHHDRLDLTTTGKGLVHELTWDELRVLDAGSWRGSEFAGEPVCSLQEALAFAVGRIPLNLDIKVPAAAERTAIAAAEAGAAGSVVITGCTQSCVKAVGDLTNGISTLLNLDEMLAEADPADAPSIAMRSVATARDLGAIAINVPHQLVDTDLVNSAREAAIGVWAYTVDDEDRFSELVAIGVDSITTNWPQRMLALTSERLHRS
jgi:glycerophosphoryl diester phosphodiesterase